MKPYMPHIKITMPDGRTTMTAVEIDGRLFPATRVRFDSGESLDGYTLVEVTFYADIEVDGHPGHLELKRTEPFK